MATPTQSQQQYSAGAYPPSAGQAGPLPQAQGGYGITSQSTPGHYGPPTTPYNFDKYVVIHIATTCDEHGVYVTKDSAEVIEMGWVVVDARDPNLPELHRESVLVKPVNTPITPLCTSLTTLTWEHVRNAGSFRDAVEKFVAFAQEHLIKPGASQNDPPSFAYVTLMPWDLRVQMPREAHDKHVVIPHYLRHPILFGLRGEYQNFQAHHPETLAFSSSTLSSICAGLEVEEVRSSGKVTGGLPFHLQALAPSSPRRAIEEALTLTRCLRSLVQKSRPSQTNPHGDPDIMTRPLDARSDVRAFLAEHSKVLHLSGLPHDTTQSELESWFTQYNGRPIAFWTLRTPEGGKPSGSGFVVFGSHEEAAESLSMNGRALNDRAIEVSPSSNRVLERASQQGPPGGPPVLTPFPPSKNRPRPGDWTCPSCGFSNFQRRTACFRCSFPAMAAQQPDPYGQQYGMGPSPYGGPGGYGQPPMMGGPQMHHGGYGGMGGSGGRGGVVPFRAGDWKCGRDGCFYHNFAKNVACLRCGAPRQEAAVVAEGNGGNNYHGHGGGSSYGPGGNMMGGSMGGSMGGGSYGGGMAPGGDPYGGGQMGGPPGGYGGQSYGPQSTYALPSGLGAPSPYMQSMHGGYGQAPPPTGQQSPGGFDSRAEQAFNQGNASATGGAPGAGYGANGGQYGAGPSGYGNDDVSLAFLNSSMGNLGFGERDDRRNGQGGQGGHGQGQGQGNAKSPQ
ncbi:Asparagine-rich protein (ARP protein) [Saxophila tyrrhenica]|uniref:Asparagine-rich protein (ARP protein) n=1 Tax=Saxophila tyrrhenica TaxID=1690608 RepID=A0AAV9NTL1_9PEZI|nr:Asparagine-rich protein (ARP protein) [Saxophila tyrrhenica]